MDLVLYFSVGLLGFADDRIAGFLELLDIISIITVFLVVLETAV
jgi:hypothetical protein